MRLERVRVLASRRVLDLWGVDADVSDLKPAPVRYHLDSVAIDYANDSGRR